MQIRILIVEDESLVAMDMSDMLMRIGYEVLPAAYSYDDAVAALESQHPDLILMDIQLGSGRTGLDLAQLVRDKYHKPFVFITSHSDRATVTHAAALRPNGYLVKPFGQEDLYTCIEVALANFAGTEQAVATTPSPWQIDASVFVKTDTKYIKLNISDIHYLESDGNYIHIVTDKSKHIIRSSFREFLPNLPTDFFMQVHKSYVIHLQKVDALSHTEVAIGKATIPLSRNYKDDLFDRIRRIQ